jgi:hypothetical protein
MYLVDEWRVNEEIYAVYHRLRTIISLRSHRKILAMCWIPVLHGKILHLFEFLIFKNIIRPILCFMQCSVLGAYRVPSSDGDHCDNHQSHSSRHVGLLPSDMLAIHEMSSLILLLWKTWSSLLPKIKWRIEMITDGTIPEFQLAVLVHSCPQGSL